MTTLNMAATARRSNTAKSPFAGLMAAASGLLAGWKGYQSFTALNELSDKDLAARGLTRADVPRLAFEAMGI